MMACICWIDMKKSTLLRENSELSLILNMIKL